VSWRRREGHLCFAGRRHNLDPGRAGASVRGADLEPVATKKTNRRPCFISVQVSIRWQPRRNFLSTRGVLAPPMTRYLLAVTIVLSWATTASSAVECKAELPSARTGYWSWRIIDGKQCWYPGRPGMSKAELHWPQSARQPARKEASKTSAALSSPREMNCRSQNGGPIDGSPRVMPDRSAPVPFCL
jgi:hypothetical protein